MEDGSNLRQLSRAAGLELHGEETNPAHADLARWVAQAEVDLTAGRDERNPGAFGDDPLAWVKPLKMLNGALAGVLGLMASTFLVFFLNLWRRSAPGRVARCEPSAGG